MTLAYKLLNHNGRSSKGGGKIWPLPNGDVPGNWISKMYGQDKYYLCKRDNMCLWIDHALFIAEFNDIIEEENGDIKVPDARLVKIIDSWNKNSQKSFMKKCYEHIVSNKESITSAQKKSVDLLKERYAAEDLIPLSKIATKIAVNPSEELKWQNNLLWGYVQEEIMNNFSKDEFA